MSKKYITTPIYYINDVPHIGHAYTTIAADVLARYYKSKGDDVFFLTGTDEHGAKIAEAAKKAGKEPKEFVDDLLPRFQEAWKKLNINYSAYIRTTDPEHEKIVQELVSRLAEKGYVEKRKYEGLYCVGCEKYLAPGDLVDGKCPDHKTEPVKQSEENYFFKLSEFQSQLIDLIESNKLIVEPASRKNEILGKLKQGLEDVSISRAGVSWGIPFPGDPSQTIYVWVDALLNYYSATKIFKMFSPDSPLPPHLTSLQAGEERSGMGGTEWESHPADLHLMAKDILWFHSVIWPAMLLALELPLPKKVFAHGFFTVGGQKMSKTIGNVLDPNKLVDKYGTDAIRYAVLREFPFGEDGDISEEKIANRYEKDLGNELGNLLQRVISMINKYEITPNRRKSYFLSDEGEIEEADEVPAAELIYDDHIKNLQFETALQSVWKLVRETNVLIDEKKPWELAKNDGELELDRVLNLAYWRLGTIATLLEPFMPETAEKMKKQLETLRPEVMFPRIDK